ncbi:MAG: tetraacyldisaccharide 4'-kinase [Deltaproteobacteria bacterium]|nr:tetraacyldisaccharide 4'-kinase [Deltaproteobacteria bacterium]
MNMERYDQGAVTPLILPDTWVVSVGNIAVGGRGKSPLACHLANWFSAKGCETTLLLRGYRGNMERAGGLVSKGEGPLVSAVAAGDEAYAAAFQCPKVTIRVGKNRVEQATCASRAGAQVIVLDDGFQHRRLGRHLDIVSITPDDVAPDAKFFPVGRLRESPGSLARADLRVGYTDDWRNSETTPPVLFEHQPNHLFTQTFQCLPLSTLPKRIHLLSAIEVPWRFTATAMQLGIWVVSTSVFTDHHRFSSHDVRIVEKKALRNGAEAILTTAKDLPRLAPFSFDCPVLGLATSLRITHGEALLHNRLVSFCVPLSAQKETIC